MAFQKHGEALNELLNANAEKKKGTEEEIDPEFLAAHIGCTVGMLDKILASCESAQKLLAFRYLWVLICHFRVLQNGRILEFVELLKILIWLK